MPRVTADHDLVHDDDRAYRVAFVEAFRHVLPLSQLRGESRLDGLELLRKGSRLSVMPLKRAAFETILKLGS